MNVIINLAVYKETGLGAGKHRNREIDRKAGRAHRVKQASFPENSL
jgi:hypothetical protein